MSQNADIAVLDRKGNLALVVEVKSVRGKSNDWAAKMRQNIMAHGLLPSAPFFLLATLDKLYLWTTEGTDLSAAEPAYTVDPKPLLEPFYRTSGFNLDALSGLSFTLVVEAWLNQVLRSTTVDQLGDGDHEWLVSSGLFEKLSGGNVDLEVAA
jgi:hypothetical protein